VLKIRHYAKPQNVGLKWPPGKLTSTGGFSQRRPRKPVLILRTLFSLIQSNGFEHDTLLNFPVWRQLSANKEFAAISVAVAAGVNLVL